MKKFYSFFTVLISIVVLSTSFSCSSSDDDSTSALQSNMYGTWRITSIVKDNGTTIDVTTYPGSNIISPTCATFRSDGTYSGSGEFGTGSGTYKVSGNTIYTYVNGEEYLKYEVPSYTRTTCKLKMEMPGSTETLTFICTKQ